MLRAAASLICGTTAAAVVLAHLVPAGAGAQTASPGGTTEPPAQSQGTMPAQSTKGTRTIRMASWRFTGPPARPEPEPRAQTAAPAWRHTFGAERHSAPWRRVGPAGFEADLIALQGLSNLTVARRLFRASSYHFVISRQALSEPAPDSGWTAVAINRRAGLRLTSAMHFLPPAGADGATDAPPAIVAVKVMAAGHAVWLASIDAPSACTAEAGRTDARAACTAHRSIVSTFADWAAQQRQAGTPVIVAGRAQDALARLPSDKHLAGKADACSTGAALLATRAARQGDTAADAAAIPAPASRPCVLLLRVSLSPAR